MPCVCTVLRKASRATTRFYEELIAPSGLTATQFALLRALERCGTTPMSRLAEELVMDRTSLYRAVQPLERDGFVATMSSPSDRRVKDVELSEIGREKILEALPYWQEAQKSLISAFGEESWYATANSVASLVTLIQSLERSTDAR